MEILEAKKTTNTTVPAQSKRQSLSCYSLASDGLRVFVVAAGTIVFSHDFSIEQRPLRCVADLVVLRVVLLERRFLAFVGDVRELGGKSLQIGDVSRSCRSIQASSLHLDPVDAPKGEILVVRTQEGPFL